MYYVYDFFRLLTLLIFALSSNRGTQSIFKVHAIAGNVKKIHPKNDGYKQNKPFLSVFVTNSWNENRTRIRFS